MSDQIIELAIRAPKKGREQQFDERKRAAVDALLRVPGVGPERAFVAFSTLPPTEPLPHIGMTRYADKAAQNLATRNLPFLGRLLPFMSSMTPMVGVMLTPDDADFDLATFASEAGLVVEFAALKPVAGVTHEEFLDARRAFLAALDEQPGVVRSYTFATLGGLKAADSIVHFTVYASKKELEKVGAQLSASDAFARFRERFVANTIAFATSD